MRILSIVLLFSLFIFASIGAIVFIFEDSYENNIIDDNTFDDIEIEPRMPPLASPLNFYNFPIPVASGRNVLNNGQVIIDYSNTQDGYIMIKLLKETERNGVARIIGPDNSEQNYFLNENNDFNVIPLSRGSGRYTVEILVQTEVGSTSHRKIFLYNVNYTLLK